jgi:predicted outer membrane lipoprotein
VEPFKYFAEHLGLELAGALAAERAAKRQTRERGDAETEGEKYIKRALTHPTAQPVKYFAEHLGLELAGASAAERAPENFVQRARDGGMQPRCPSQGVKAQAQC